MPIRPTKQLEVESTFEKPRHHRIQVEARVYVHDNERLYAATTENLSLGGVFIGGPLPFYVGQRVHLVIKLPNMERTVQVQGTIVRTERKDQIGIGIQFVQLSANNAELIKTCIWQTILAEAVACGALEFPVSLNLPGAPGVASWA